MKAKQLQYIEEIINNLCPNFVEKAKYYDDRFFEIERYNHINKKDILSSCPNMCDHICISFDDKEIIFDCITIEIKGFNLNYLILNYDDIIITNCKIRKISLKSRSIQLTNCKIKILIFSNYGMIKIQNCEYRKLLF